MIARKMSAYMIGKPRDSIVDIVEYRDQVRWLLDNTMSHHPHILSHHTGHLSKTKVMPDLPNK